MLNFKNAFTKGHYFLDKSDTVWLYRDFYLILNEFYLYLAIVFGPNYKSKKITKGWHISDRRLIGLNLLHEQLVDEEW